METDEAETKKSLQTKFSLKIVNFHFTLIHTRNRVIF